MGMSHTKASRRLSSLSDTYSHPRQASLESRDRQLIIGGRSRQRCFLEPLWVETQAPRQAVIYLRVTIAEDSRSESAM